MSHESRIRRLETARAARPEPPVTFIDGRYRLLEYDLFMLDGRLMTRAEFMEAVGDYVLLFCSDEGADVWRRSQDIS